VVGGLAFFARGSYPVDDDYHWRRRRGGGNCIHQCLNSRFTVEFDAPKSEIENWILKSKGLQQKPSEIIKNTRIFEVRGYENSMGGKVYIKDNHVKINMMWS
jgi:hypothetical protein